MTVDSAALLGLAERGASIPVITLWQPWASLIFATDADGVFIKQHETRGWRYPDKLDGAIIAIHAAKIFPSAKYISDDLHELCLDVFGCSYNHSLPLGGIIGTVTLMGCLPTKSFTPSIDDQAAGDWRRTGDNGKPRWAWRLSDQMPIDGGRSFLPWKGKQGWGRVPAAALRAHATHAGSVAGVAG